MHLFAALALVGAAAALPAPVPVPGGIPTAATAKSNLAALTVKTPGSTSGYSRDLFPHWISQGGGCDTRDVVLKRDSSSAVVTSGSCTIVSGNWLSPYDGAEWTAPGDVDIDHMVPLANAWISGASAWTTAQRQAYANDLTNPQLWTVTDNVNQSKGDRSPDAWKPSLTSEWCRYARSWIKVKYVYSLSVSSAEKSALTTMLGYC